MLLDKIELFNLQPEDFIRAAYRSVLGREVDPEGLRHFIGQLRKGYRKQLILLDLAMSREGQSIETGSVFLRELTGTSQTVFTENSTKTRAIVVLTYNRYSYFKMVLPSLLKQEIFGRSIFEEYKVFVFQDGPSDALDKSIDSEHKKISLMLEQTPLQVNVIKHETNLGIARQYDFAERLIFQELNFEVALFFEDDMILAPGYLHAMNLMANKFQNDVRVGMFSACPDDPTMALEIQRQHSHSFREMGHSWGFGISRWFWELRQPFVDIYLNILGSSSYEQRPHQEIYEWLGAAGFEPAASSQDYVKQCGTIALGACRLSTFANFGLPIGRRGAHFTPETFEALGFNRSVVFDATLDEVPDFNNAQYEYLISGNQYADRPQRYGLRNPESFSRESWLRRLSLGEFDKRAIPSATAETGNASTETRGLAKVSIETSPHMAAEETDALETRLLKSRSYIEYGAGGSTIMAFNCGVADVYCVESDQAYLEAVSLHAAAFQNTSKFHPHYQFIGPTQAWGYPATDRFARTWPKYCIEIWQKLREYQATPDLVLIDGRFRVACFLASLCFAKIGTVILFDDYRGRLHYHSVEEFITPSAVYGELAEFIKPEGLCYPDIFMQLSIFVSDPR